MNKVLIFVLTLAIVSCNGTKDDGSINSDVVNNSATADGKPASDLPEIKFEEEVYDFGKMTQGEKVSHAFYFKNTGSRNLIISGASGSCGCTVPTWPKEPIKSGKSEKINVVFNSDGKSGYQEKTVTLITNCEPATRVIRIKAEIIVPETAK
ncbi:MAG: DUF1573 domain-containing protein [Bacteroidetes bacterium]|nr:DUF1573 domain-containing protein [Bacteroidota bacterium]